jgi:hypothetical protein
MPPDFVGWESFARWRPLRRPAKLSFEKIWLNELG